MVILITGASRGIGREIAITLSKEGHKIIANYNKEKVSKVDDKLLAQILELYKSTNSKLDTINDKIKINIYTFYMFAV